MEQELSASQRKLVGVDQTPQVMVDEAAKHIVDDVMRPNFS